MQPKTSELGAAQIFVARHLRRYGLGYFNAAVLLGYLSVLDVSGAWPRNGVLALASLCISCNLLAAISTRWVDFVLGFQMSVLSLVLFFASLETLRFAPTLIPAVVSDFLKTGQAAAVKVEVNEYLDESPYVKFKPLVVARSQGNRGTDRQFAYEWKTDRLGFKNADEILDGRPVTAVALGDSFTEAMGVATPNTWPAVLTRLGYTTYNFGVQGYAPVQMEGTLRRYGLAMKPKYTIVGYTGTIYDREKAFFTSAQAPRGQKFTGLNSSVGVLEVRGASTQVTTAVLLFLQRRWINLHDEISVLINKTRNPDSLYQRYAAEMRRAEEVTTTEAIAKDPAFLSALGAVSRIKTMSDQIHAKVLFLYFPHRGEVYYQRATGKKLPANHFEAVEARVWKESCEALGIEFLDITDRIRNYVNRLDKNAAVSEYPFLETDGHMSARGQELIAEMTAEKLASMERHPPNTLTVRKAGAQ
jgi:hypothetical protein